MSLFGKYRVYVIFLCVVYLIYRYTRQSKVESFIVKGGHGNIVLSEDDVGLMLATLFNTPKLSKASFVRIMKDVVDIDVSKDYTVTSGQILALAKKMPVLKIYDAKRRRRIVHFYETDPDVKKLFDDHFIKKTESFIASNDEEVKATWSSFKKLFGSGGGEERINLGKKYNTFKRKLPNPLKTKLDTRTPQLEKLFKQFYKLKTGKEYSEGDQLVAIQGVSEQDMLEDDIKRVLKSPEDFIKVSRNLQDAFEPILTSIVNIRFDTPAFGIDANLYSVMGAVHSIIKGETDLTEENRKEVLRKAVPIIKKHMDRISETWDKFRDLYAIYKDGGDTRKWMKGRFGTEILEEFNTDELKQLKTNIVIPPFTEDINIKDPIPKVFATFYKAVHYDTFKNKVVVELDDDVVTKASQGGSSKSESSVSRDDKTPGIQDMQKEINDLRRIVQSIVDKTMEQKSKSKSNSNSGDNIYDDPASDALSKKMLAYLMKKKKTVKEFKIFVRAMVITGREEFNPLVDLQTQIHQGIRFIVSGNGDDFDDLEDELDSDFDSDDDLDS